MSNERQPIRNPTVEELERVSRKKQNIGAVEARPVRPKSENQDEDLVKPQDDFEPDPVLFEVPSGRTTIPKKFLSDDNEILIRRITTKEEAMFHDFDKLPFSEAIEPQIDACLKTNLPIGEFSSIDKLAMYLFLIGKTYGQKFDVDVQCEACRTASKVKDVDIIGDIEIKKVPKDYEYPKKIEFETYKKERGLEITAYFRFPKIREAGIIDGSMDIYQQMQATCVSIVNKEGKEYSDEEKEKIIANLNSDDRNKFRKFIQEFDEFGANLFVKNKKVCKNTKCKEKYNKLQPFILPIESVLGEIILRVRENQ